MVVDPGPMVDLGPAANPGLAVTWAQGYMLFACSLVPMDRWIVTSLFLFCHMYVYVYIYVYIYLGLIINICS